MSDDIRKPPARPETGETAKERLQSWIVVFATLLASLMLWGLVILLGREMFRRINAEIGAGVTAFRAPGEETPTSQ